jgi:hypothetical protein
MTTSKVIYHKFDGKIIEQVRPLSEIAREISKDWTTMPVYAKAHFRAFQYANSIDEMYGCDSVKNEVLYFLSNASTWRGETAKRVKIELKKMAGIK